jgi:hypothetical protein
MARLVAWWVRFYTRDLPAPIAERRLGEIDADLHDHIAHERARGTADPRIAASILGRMLRGLAADLSWRGHTAARRRAGRVALATTLILLVPLVAMQFTDQVDWGVFDFVFAAVLLGGAGLLLQELAARSARSLAFRAVATAIAVAAMVLGDADDAPGLVLFGCLLIVATLALAFRTAQRS